LTDGEIRSIFTDASHPWNGSVNGTMVSEGVYIYQIDARDHINFLHTFVGIVTLLKQAHIFLRPVFLLILLRNFLSGVYVKGLVIVLMRI